MTEHDAQDAAAIWEQRYADAERIWSGRVNARLAEVAAELRPGRALDLGAGEGADAIWLAGHGWQVVAADISGTALARAAADAGPLADRIDFQRHDLTETFPDGTFDLVSAQFLHSRAAMDRPALLRRAAAAVAPGGVLLIVDHGEAPPWAGEHAQHHDFPGVHDVLAGLGLDGGWQVLRAETCGRDAVGPDGAPGHLLDNVIVARRRSGDGPH